MALIEWITCGIEIRRPASLTCSTSRSPGRHPGARYFTWQQVFPSQNSLGMHQWIIFGGWKHKSLCLEVCLNYRHSKYLAKWGNLPTMTWDDYLCLWILWGSKCKFCFSMFQLKATLLMWSRSQGPKNGSRLTYQYLEASVGLSVELIKVSNEFVWEWRRPVKQPFEEAEKMIHHD